MKTSGHFLDLGWKSMGGMLRSRMDDVTAKSAGGDF